jgi:transcriptional regulator with XRE-family HTH domain
MRADVFFSELESAYPEVLKAGTEVDSSYLLAANVYRLRRARGMSQSALAVEAGVTQPRIAELERGDANPRLSTLARVAAALACQVHELIAREESSADLIKESTTHLSTEGEAGVFLLSARYHPERAPNMVSGRTQANDNFALSA